MIVDAAIQEDVDIVSMSILSGAHMTLFARILDLLKERGAGDIHVIGGGIIPEDDAAKLREMGVGAIFGPGTPTTEPIEYIKRWHAQKG